MVFFCCNNCGSALKKNQVEKHMGSCRCTIVSCMDCQKEFRGNEFQAHTKCISEQEKYSAPDWKPPSSHNKGERKQQAWVETVNAVLEKERNNMTPAQAALLKTVAKHDNVPRKKPKFANFTRNIARNSFDQQTIDSVFDLLEAEWKRQAEANKPPQTNGTSKEQKEDTTNGSHTTNGISNENGHTEASSNGTEDGGKKKSKKNKRKRAEEDEENAEVKKKKGEEAQETEAGAIEETNGNTDENASAEFRWGEVIQQILLTREDQTISLKKLKKKVFAEYYARVGDSKGVKTKEDLSALLNKKLKKKKFKVINDTVQLANVE